MATFIVLIRAEVTRTAKLNLLAVRLTTCTTGTWPANVPMPAESVSKHTSKAKDI